MKKEQPITLKGPYETSIIVHISDGQREGKVTVNLTMAQVPTQQDVDEALALAQQELGESGFRLMSKTEFFNVMMRERLGAKDRFACPNGDNWD